MENQELNDVMSKKFNAVLVEDDLEIRADLRNLIIEGHKNISIIGEAADVPSAAELITKLAPDLLFLDVNLGKRDGFQLLERLQPVTFPVIFTTGSTDHMKKAIDLHLPYTGYITKPYLAEPLDKEIRQAMEFIEARRAPMPTAPAGMVVSDRKIGLPDGKTLIMVHLDNILYCESDDPGTRVFTSHPLPGRKLDGKGFYVAKGIGKFREALESHGFGSPSQSAVVNLKSVDSLTSIDEGGDVMIGTKRLTVSRGFKKEFFALFDRVQ